MNSKPSPNPATKALREQVLGTLFSQPYLRELLNGLESASVFVKSADGRLLFGNKNLIRHLGLPNESALIGLTDEDLHPPHLVRKYRDDDLGIIRSGREKLHIVELFKNEQGVLRWYVTQKYPVFDSRRRVVGVMGTIQEYGKIGGAIGSAESGVLAAAEFIQKNYQIPISLRQLSLLSRMPIRQFERKFKQLFDSSPREYAIRHRLQQACEALRNSRKAISAISAETGFYDQSSFSRQFKKYLHVTPMKYRRGKYS